MIFRIFSSPLSVNVVPANVADAGTPFALRLFRLTTYTPIREAATAMAETAAIKVLCDQLTSLPLCAFKFKVMLGLPFMKS